MGKIPKETTEMKTQLNTTRLDTKLEELRTKLAEAEEYNSKIVKSAEHYLGVVEAILKRRKIPIKSHIIYYSGTEEFTRALLHIKFEESISDKRAKALKKALIEAKVPCPISSFTHEVPVTLYNETLID